MIAIVFILVMGAVVGLASLFGPASGAAAASAASVPWWALAAVLVAFVGFFAGGIYVGAALAMLSLLAGFGLSDRPFWNFIGEMIWGPSTNFVLVSVPLFLLMGEIMLRAGLSERLYRALNVWMGRLPGGLLHTNIMACGVFSAVAGSSVATAATMGSVALPYFEKSHYPPRLVLGSLAAGGALGNLIPPGITFIIYGLITETSVGALYLAAVGPSVLVVLLFTLTILFYSYRLKLHGDAGGASVGWAQRLASLSDLVPTALLIGLVLGTIYAGWATPTESAALGVAGAIVLSLVDRKLSWKMMSESMRSTARTTSMIALILFGAYFLNYILSSLGIPQMLAKFLTSLPLPGWAIMLVIIGFYLALGTFMEGMSMVITTIPLLFPVVKALGYDPIWFGVVITMLVEIAMISPPDGTVLYVLQGMRRQPGPITDVFSGVMPFMFVYMLAIIVLMLFPAIALWLPAALM
ncbi:TRAP transporter large permease [Curvibacter sp. RS43]|uniref:TRAP transporter large permease protein n=1 Tax=Curvibacter microcysteis TaxID=3026419 RepID=A0ABT5MG05_9BURK|nr:MULTISPECIES: TRAP transporter large permease [unclassified Curvibacter]MDD0810764.1 TRAP transporter large permease [Curvibacter sp. RS43]MDD0815498.1 TRAP transporter large permease [Curvibacter sp. HBC28]